MCSSQVALLNMHGMIFLFQSYKGYVILPSTPKTCELPQQGKEDGWLILKGTNFREPCSSPGLVNCWEHKSEQLGCFKLQFLDWENQRIAKSLLPSLPVPRREELRGSGSYKGLWTKTLTSNNTSTLRSRRPWASFTKLFRYEKCR